MHSRLQSNRRGSLVVGIAALVFACPGSGLCILGFFALLNEEIGIWIFGSPAASLGSWAFLCLGWILILVPMLVALYWFWPKKKPEEIEGFDEPLPPAI